MLRRLTRRLAREESGFTLIELLTVSAILGILTSMAAPSYLTFRNNADKAAASANLSAIVPDVEWYAYDNAAGAAFSRDPDYNGSDAAYTGTNADTGYADVWAGHDVISLLQSKYDVSIVTSRFTWDPAGWAPTAGMTTSTDYCVYTSMGTWYAAKHGPGGAITKGQTMHIGANGDCYAS
ncbi:MAG TPA: prepilin-type N-terminal cleavage/methylation domain-containing protein [Gaiellaceae bacterium]|nr:prepilin-type N-terminal cleavage/methylation domain-containing protein [Gaiellaceae bacterium]